MSLLNTLLIGALGLGTAQLAAQAPAPQERPTTDAAAPAYMLRANPRWAREINEVLARVARRAEMVVPRGQTVEDFLIRFCGGPAPAHETAEATDAGLFRILASPCVRIKRDARLKVTDGDTLEGLAVRNGLPRTAATSLKVIAPGRSSASRLQTPQSLKTGDVVVIPELPLWTHIVADPRVAVDRAALVAALAARLKCGTEDPEACLADREVTLLNRASVPEHREPEIQLPEAVNRLALERARASEEARRRRSAGESAAAPTASPRASAVGRRSATGEPVAGYSAGIVGGTATPPPPPLPGAAPPSVASATASPGSETPAAFLPVAPEQWPYDVNQLAAILKEVAHTLPGESTIGIADGGLANLAGGPLPPTLFAPGPEKRFEEPGEPPEPNGVDNDGNEYVDDLFGAGVPRVDEQLGTGDIGLCKAAQPSFASWDHDPLNTASHGAIVSSVAAALGVRRADAAAADALPKLVFFRMLGNTCAQDVSMRVAEAELVTAFEYLKNRAGVINISYTVDGDSGRRFATAIKEILPYHNVLLVLPAGNDTPRDLDDNGICPACLGSDAESRGDKAAKRTLVVGGATRDLKKAPFSNFGERTVGIFAPAEPTDATDLADRKVPASEAATSYAAPLVALAAGIISSFSPNQNPMDLKDRLAAAIWPLDDPESGPERRRVGVLDLLKAAAVRHHAVEVKESDTDGQFVRRTYVGTLLTPLNQLKLCAGRQFMEAGVHAIRLGEPRPDGERLLRIYHREKKDPQTQLRVIERDVPCRPQGELRIRTLLHGDKVFPLADVREIQLRWLLGS